MTSRCRSRESRRHWSIGSAAAALTVGLLLGCSATSIDKPGGTGASSAGGNGTAAFPSFGGDLMTNNVGPRCQDGDESLKCKVMDCPADSSPSTTTVSGKVYDPAGRVPLYNAVVYIVEDPKTTLKPLGQRVKCESCSEHFPKTAMAVALTKSDGSFRLTDVPAGKDIPLVIQLGKWRRVVEIDVAPCTDNPLTAEKTRLPRNSTEGDLPKIAVTTGGSDALECLLKKIGVDESEFTPDNET
ncbi:MAG TPA: carboxypeptidase regulatory-like domain-containing protein, partial [Polyangiaceae bacterium]|nr:carboxypeptidase regulatory-like domain-containing protein [Polyangiaceae bacterium]